jgi:hypothetical protein
MKECYAVVERRVSRGDVWVMNLNSRKNEVLKEVKDLHYEYADIMHKDEQAGSPLKRKIVYEIDLISGATLSNQAAYMRILNVNLTRGVRLTFGTVSFMVNHFSGYSGPTLLGVRGKP